MNQIDPQIQNLRKNPILRLEMIVDAARLNSSIVGDLPECGRRVTLTPEEAGCRLEHLIPRQLCG